MIKASAAALLLFAAVAGTKSCPDKNPPSPPPTPSPVPTASPPTPAPPPTAVPDLFASVVRPIVLEHCTPCHEPGGKMYGRLPFDDPKVLSSHSEGVLRRLKGDDKEAFQRWIASLK
ncbi:MAG TPA: hypothetical protein VKG01_06860 [Thermoanaerobaculia bacterium]|nr:hypothetical protein [Thermoanaerobaculia bacterium]